MADESILLDVVDSLKAMLKHTDQMQCIVKRIATRLDHQQSLLLQIGDSHSGSIESGHMVSSSCGDSDVDLQSSELSTDPIVDLNSGDTLGLALPCVSSVTTTSTKIIESDVGFSSPMGLNWDSISKPLNSTDVTQVATKTPNFEVELHRTDLIFDPGPIVVHTPYYNRLISMLDIVGAVLFKSSSSFLCFSLVLHGPIISNRCSHFSDDFISSSVGIWNTLTSTASKFGSLWPIKFDDYPLKYTLLLFEIQTLLGAVHLHLRTKHIVIGICVEHYQYVSSMAHNIVVLCLKIRDASLSWKGGTRNRIISDLFTLFWIVNEGFSNMHLNTGNHVVLERLELLYHTLTRCTYSLPNSRCQSAMNRTCVIIQYDGDEGTDIVQTLKWLKQINNFKENAKSGDGLYFDMATTEIAYSKFFNVIEKDEIFCGLEDKNSEFQQLIVMIQNEMHHKKILNGKMVIKNSSVVFLLLPTCAYLTWLDAGKQIDEMVKDTSFDEALIVWNTWVDMFVNRGQMADVQVISNFTCQKYVVKWTSMMNRYIVATIAENVLVIEAILLCNAMRLHGVLPNEATLKCVLPVYVITSLKQVINFHSYLIRSQFVSTKDLATGTIEICSHSGSLQHAYMAFDEIKFKEKIYYIMECQNILLLETLRVYVFVSSPLPINTRGAGVIVPLYLLALIIHEVALATPIELAKGSCSHHIITGFMIQGGAMFNQIGTDRKLVYGLKFEDAIIEVCGDIFKRADYGSVELDVWFQSCIVADLINEPLLLILVPTYLPIQTSVSIQPFHWPHLTHHKLKCMVPSIKPFDALYGHKPPNITDYLYHVPSNANM